MSTQVLLNSPALGELVHQTYKLPWPLKQRELLMHCSNEISHRHATITATCHSAETPLVPITNDAVRMEIVESSWKFESIPGNGKMKTKISVYILISDKFAIGMRARVDEPLLEVRAHEGR